MQDTAPRFVDHLKSQCLGTKGKVEFLVKRWGIGCIKAAQLIPNFLWHNKAGTSYAID